jgi:hypothetical protein
MAKSKQKRNNMRRRLANRKAREAARSARADQHPRPALDRLPLAFCRLNANWRDNGTAFIYVARQAGGGRIRAGFFYVDVWGVGVKDCFLAPHEAPSEALAWLEIQGERFETRFEECTEELARQLIWGGLSYGKEAGFLPPREFHHCKKLIPRLAEDEWDRSLFGKDGERLVIGDLHELMKRSKGRYDPNREDGHFLIGGPVFDEDDLLARGGGIAARGRGPAGGGWMASDDQVEDVAAPVVHNRSRRCRRHGLSDEPEPRRKDDYGKRRRHRETECDGGGRSPRPWRSCYARISKRTGLQPLGKETVPVPGRGPRNESALPGRDSPQGHDADRSRSPARGSTRPGAQSACLEANRTAMPKRLTRSCAVGRPRQTGCPGSLHLGVVLFLFWSDRSPTATWCIRRAGSFEQAPVEW